MKKLENNLHRRKENKDDEILRPENKIICCCRKFSLGLKNNTSFSIQNITTELSINGKK